LTPQVFHTIYSSIAGHVAFCFMFLRYFWKR